MPSVTEVDVAVDRCLEILAHHPSGLFSDFDGTLSAIAATPDAAIPFAGAVEAIDAINRHVDHFAIVTGRAAGNAVEKIGIPDLQVIGNHGLEMVRNGEHTAHPVGVAARSHIDLAMAEISAGISAATDPAGMVFENKAYTASIHYRNTPAPDVIETHLRPLVLDVAQRHELRVTGGKMMFELRPSVIVSKGTALADLISEHHLQGVIFIGDDVTDVDGFEVLHSLEGVHTLAVGVMSEETHPSVLEHSDILLAGVGEVVQMLQGIAARLAKEIR